MKIKLSTKIQMLGWLIYWILLLIINLFFFKEESPSKFILILWTIMFTAVGIIIFYGLTQFYKIFLKKNLPLFSLIFISSFLGAYIWTMFEPIIAWIINPNINKLSIAWDINSRGAFPYTFIVAFFSTIYCFSEKLKPYQIPSSNYPNDNTTNVKTVSLYYKNNIVLLPIHDIKKIEVFGNYTEIIDNKNNKYQKKKSLQSWESELPLNDFIRIHRSILINKTFIQNISLGENYTYEIKLHNSDAVLNSSRRYSSILKNKLNLQ